MLAGCNLVQPNLADPHSQSQPKFIPPTLVSSTPLGSGVVTPQPLVQVENCTDDLKFIRDVTIPDGTFVSRSVTLDKQWEVENTGSCHWTKDYSLRLIGGPDLGANARQALYPALSGTHAVLEIIFTSPAEVGTYRTAWQAYNPADQPFGDPIYMEIVVTESNQ